jgi:hypothetical protein
VSILDTDLRTITDESFITLYATHACPNDPIFDCNICKEYGRRFDNLETNPIFEEYQNHVCLDGNCDICVAMKMDVDPMGGDSAEDYM